MARRGLFPTTIHKEIGMKLPDFSTSRNSIHRVLAVLGALACATPAAAATSGYVGLSVGQ